MSASGLDKTKITKYFQDQTPPTAQELANLKSGTVSIAKEVACLNKDFERVGTGNAWTSLEDALAYGRTFTLYGINGTVYVITYSY